VAVSSIAELNVAIRADIRGLEKGIRDAQRVLTNAGQSFTTLGNNLSMALTLPLASFGIASVKAAGDMERLRLGLEATMTGAGYSIAQTRDEMKLLNEAAKAPGLDLEQAVKGSLRLQNVGYSAEKARQVMAQFANAVAAAGGTAQNFDGVTTQLTQMIGKGKILNEDLKVMKENMPGVAKAMIDAFGTADAEGIRALGISTTEFTDRLVAQLAKMPRVSGGISNAIVNAGVSIKQFLATVGEELNKTFNITGNLEAFSNWLGNLSKQFTEADSSTRALIIGTGVLLAALGPLTRAVGLAVQGVGALTLAYRNLKIAKLAIVEVGFIKYWKALDTAMKVTVIGAVLAGILALVLAFKALNKEMSPAEKAQRSINAAHQEAAHSIAAEKSQAELLTNVLKSETATREEKNAALKKLQGMAPEIFGNLSTEKLKVDDVNKALNQYIVLIEKRARLAALNQKLVEVETKLYDTQKGLNKEADPSIWQQMGNAIQSLGSQTHAMALNAVDFANNSTKLTENLNKEKEALIAEIGTLQTFELTAEKAKTATGGLSKETDKMAKTLSSVTTALKVYDSQTNLLGGSQDRVTGKINLLRASMEKLQKAGFADTSTEVQKLKAELEKLATARVLAPLAPIDTKAMPTQVQSIALDTTTLNEEVNIGDKATKWTNSIREGFAPLQKVFLDVNAGIMSVTDSLAVAAQAAQASGDVMGAAMLMTSSAIAQYTAEGSMSLKGLGKVALIAAMDFVKAETAKAISLAISKSMERSGHPLLGLALGAIAAAGVSAMFDGAMSGIKTPKLAQGGLAFGPTMAMVGDNQGARTNPEVIAPLSKLKSMIGAGRMGNNNNSGGTLTARVSAREMQFMLESEQSRTKRTR
jgi:tape measure domain-containing protein